MKPVIVIGTTYGRSGWLEDCLDSLFRSYILVANADLIIHPIYSDKFELSVIAQAAELYDEFIYLPDSTEVLDPAGLIHKCFETRESVSLSQFPDAFGMYLGKYRADHVKKIGVPVVANKIEAVRYETIWTRQYAALAPYLELGSLPHSDVFVEKHGRVNMVCENRWLRRYKASWDSETMQQEHERIESLKGAK